MICSCSPLGPVAALGLSPHPGPGPHAMMGTDWSQESSEQVLRNTAIPAIERTVVNWPLTQLTKCVRSRQREATRSFAARQTGQL